METNLFKITNLHPVNRYTEALYQLVMMLFFATIVFLMLLFLHTFFIFIESGVEEAVYRFLFLPTFIINNPSLLLIVMVVLFGLYIHTVQSFRKGRVWHKINGPFDVEVSQNGFQVNYPSVPLFQKASYLWSTIENVAVVDSKTVVFEKKRNGFFKFILPPRAFRLEFTDLSQPMEIFVKKHSDYVNQK